MVAGLILVFQFAIVASAHSQSRSSKVPLPTPAPATPQSADNGPETAQSPTPPPDVWSASEIADARRVCTNALKSMSAEITDVPPIKKGLCGSPAPVRLASIGKTNPVKFVPAPTISCGMLVPLKRWIDKGLQPAAARILDSKVSTVSIISSYSCRTRYGRKGAKMSEHAFANALDISGFRLADGRRVSVLKDWGLTKRDIAKAIAAAKAEKLKQANAPDPSVAPLSSARARAAKRQPAPADSSTKTARVPAQTSLPEVQIDARSSTKRQRERARQQRTFERRRLELQRTARAARIRAPLDRPTRRGNRFIGNPEPGAFGVRRPLAAPPPLPVRRPLRRAVRRRVNLIQPAPPTTTRRQLAPARDRKFKAPYQLGGPKPAKSAPRSIFLRAIHQSACRIFGTTLGPEANEAHRNHFHFDMFPRKRRGYCE